jgi:hypothetical protein
MVRNNNANGNDGGNRRQHRNGCHDTVHFAPCEIRFGFWRWNAASDPLHINKNIKYVRADIPKME